MRQVSVVESYWQLGLARSVKSSKVISLDMYFLLLTWFWNFFPCSGAGLHVGHPLGYTATDILSRFKRMKGYNVLHPMGWDAFGLPAEQYAIQVVQPSIGFLTKNY
jgi:hypothetical protein